MTASTLAPVRTAEDRKHDALVRSAAHDVTVFSAEAEALGAEESVEKMRDLVRRVETGPAPVVYKDTFIALMTAKILRAVA